MPSKINPDMRAVQAELLKRFAQLQKVLDSTTNFDAAQAIVREMQELNHRVTVAGSLLFASKSSALSAKVATVRTASNKASKAIREYSAVKDIMDAITGFLGLVDEVIDFAKLL